MFGPGYGMGLEIFFLTGVNTTSGFNVATKAGDS
jgi:hypothetical protein